MNCEELLTAQAEMVLAEDPGIPGEQPRVWVCEFPSALPPIWTSARSAFNRVHVWRHAEISIAVRRLSRCRFRSQHDKGSELVYFSSGKARRPRIQWLVRTVCKLHRPRQ